MKATVNQNDFTWQQSIDITRIIWKGAHDGFIESMASFIYDNGYSVLTDKYIDFDEANEITEYLKLTK